MMVELTRLDIQMLIYALSLACEEAHTMIAICPDVVLCADEINRLRAEIEYFNSLQTRLKKCR